MWQIVSKVFFAIFMLGIMLVFSACSSGVPTPEDIPAPASVEAQPAPETPPLNQAEATAANLPVEIPAPEMSPMNTPVNTPEPTPTDLPTEIAEPFSPLALPALEPAPAAVPQAGPPPPGSEATVAAAIANLSQQTTLPADQISVTSVEAMDWPDASLGCPQVGMMYAQVVTPGYLIVLMAQGKAYKYHTDQKANVALCNK